MSESGTTTLRDYVATIKQQRWIVLVVTLIFAGVAFGLSTRQDRTYRAQARLVVHDLSQSYALTGASNVAAVPPAQLASQEASLAIGHAVVKAAAAQLHERNEGALSSSLSSRVDLGTNAIVLEAEGATGGQAADRVNAIAQQAVARSARSQERDIGAAITSLQNQVKNARASLKRKEAGSDIRLATALQRLAQLQTVRDVAQPLEILRTASPPKLPISPRPVRDTLLGALLGLVLGLLAAFGRNALDRRVRSSSEITEALGLPLIGRVPDAALGSAGLLTAPKRTKEEHVEALAVVRANLAFLDAEHPPRSVIVTSALAGEGKTTVSCGLAAAAAAAGRRVLLIEGDLRRPAIAERLGIERGPGLGDYLAGHATPQEILQTVALPAAAGEEEGSRPTVVCITAGVHRERPAELLQSARCRQLLEQVREVYDLVVVDSTPLLSVADAIEVMPHVDGTVVCVRAGRTTRDQVRAARTALERVPARPSGVVVTGLTKGDEERYEYYSYAYRGKPDPEPASRS